MTNKLYNIVLFNCLAVFIIRFFVTDYFLEYLLDIVYFVFAPNVYLFILTMHNNEKFKNYYLNVISIAFSFLTPALFLLFLEKGIMPSFLLSIQLLVYYFLIATLYKIVNYFFKIQYSFPIITITILCVSMNNHFNYTLFNWEQCNTTFVAYLVVFEIILILISLLLERKNCNNE